MTSPLPVEITSTLNQALDADLASLRDLYIEIKVNGAKYLPWRDAIVASNPSNADERWSTAREIIARDKVPGGDLSLVYQVGSRLKSELIAMGYPSQEALLQADPAEIPFETIKGIGAKKAGQIRAVLTAERNKSPVLPPPGSIPPAKPCEFFVDYEYFTNVDVDFDRQWPTLEGYEMVFMIGVGWQEKGAWRFDKFQAGAEDPSHERGLFEAFIAFLDSQTTGCFTDPVRMAIYHWSSAEAWQTQRVADRHQLAEDHPMRRLPWVNLQKVFLDGPAAIPGAQDFGLKTVARAVESWIRNSSPNGQKNLKQASRPCS